MSGLGGRCLESTCFYVVPFVDASDEIQTLRATGVARISSLGASAPHGDVEKRFLLAAGWAVRLGRPTEDADMSSLGRYVFGSEISYNKAPPRLPGLGC